MRNEEYFIGLGIFPRYARQLPAFEIRLGRKLSPSEAKALAILLQAREGKEGARK